MHVIRTAHSRDKQGFRAYSYELVMSPRYGRQVAGMHVASGDTLAEAQAKLQALIAHDWHSLGLAIPETVDCGRVAQAHGFAHVY